MTDRDELAGIRDLHKTIDDAMGVLAAFLSVAASAEIPGEALIDAAHETVGDLAEWRARLWEIAQSENGPELPH